MITYTKGNLLEADVDALVNTVNTVGVMGKGIALMFKERFTENFKQYAAACKAGQVNTGKMFIVKQDELLGPQWIVNFPTKQHWRTKSKMEWIVDGLLDLRHFLIENNVKSIALPPLGAGNGGLPWVAVREQIEAILADVTDIEILVYEPISEYQNVAKRTGVEKLTPARALISELIRQYWVLGMECSFLEVQKLAWFLERAIGELIPDNNPLNLQFKANRYGPYADKLRHLMEHLDGSYLQSNKRINDADPLDVIWFDEKKKTYLETYLKSSEMMAYIPALKSTVSMIDGFESPFGMELLSTVDWLIIKDKCEPSVASIRKGLQSWSGGTAAAIRKDALFNDRAIDIALQRIQKSDINHLTA